VKRQKEPPAAWTTETLRVHFHQLLDEKDKRDQQRFEAQEKALADALLAVEKSTQATFVAADRATTKAEMAADERFKAVNAFREQLNDLIGTFMPRAEASNRIDSLGSRMEAAATVINDRIERVNHEVDGLASKIDKSEGRTTGLTSGGQILVAIVGLVATVLTIVIAIGAWT
jgi:hypothetical protein